MRIELNSGGLDGLVSIASYQADMSSYISKAENVIDSFALVQSATRNLNGGVGNLQEPLSSIETRLQKEKDRRDDAERIYHKTNEFLELAIRVDQQVAADVRRNQNEFYRVNPWLKPSPPANEDKPWWEKAWEALVGVAEAAVTVTKIVVDAVVDTAKKLWDSAVSFYMEHKKLIDTVLQIVGAISTIALVIGTGGLALAPLLAGGLALFGVSAAAATAIAATISTVVAVIALVSTIGSTILNVTDIWAEIDNPVFNAFQNFLNFTSSISKMAYSFGNLYNRVKHIDPQKFVDANLHPGANTTPGVGKITDCSQLDREGYNRIVDYTDQDKCSKINAANRGLRSPDPHTVYRIDGLDNTLNNTALPENTTLFRGTTTRELGDLSNLSPDQLSNRIIPESSFLSASRSPDVANDFIQKAIARGDNPVYLTIDVPKGAPGLDISSISRAPWEQEVLFANGRNLRILESKFIDKILHLHVQMLP